MGNPARVRHALPPVVALVLFAAAFEVLRTELRTVTWAQLSHDVAQVPLALLVAAAVLTVVNYALLTAYDFLALAYIGRHLPCGRVAFTSFVAYAVANNVGWAMLSGASIRYRFYTRWGITTEELVRIVFSYSVTFWIGLLMLGGVCLVSTPLLPPAIVSAHTHSAVGSGVSRMYSNRIGWVPIAVSLAYVVATFVRQQPLRLRRLELPLPRPRLAIAQLLVSVADWAVAGTVLYVLLPPGRASYFTVLGAFLTGQILGLASHVPGGVGVFESLLLIMLKPFFGTVELASSLVVYRAVYYIAPLAIAVVALAGDELHQRRVQAARVTAAIDRIAEQVTPRLLAIFTFLSGAVLLFSGATPAAAGRLALSERIFPLGVIETSHFAGSLVGAALLVLSQGIARRLDAAYFLGVIGIAVGIVASLLKGGDFEEAIWLALVLMLLARARKAFDRRAAFFDTRFSPSWIVAVAGVMGASIWLGLFAFKHVEYSNQLWWQFEVRGEASRFLRASVGAAIVLALTGLTRLIGYAPHEATAPTDEELAEAGAIIPTQSSTVPYLVYLRDKTLLFDDQRKGFVMYAVQGRTWVALGDPVGPEQRTSALIRMFLERCDDFGGTPVFYEVRKEQLFHYADFGLAFVKLGEDATVNLDTFTLDGAHASKHRQTLRRLEKQDATFRVVPGEGLIDRLREVSDDWLRSKAAAEKGFSLGFFEPSYLSRFPIGVIEQRGALVAFANLWPGPHTFELSVDLMRYRHDAPKEVMEGLLIHLMLWARAQGYRRFVLGMAPLSGFEQTSVGPLWNKLGSFIYEHGDAFYNFRGLRAYKEKFSPEWEPRYLVYPGGLRLPRILTDVAALVAGGYRRILLK
jgi:phosphatidylglycerol lysyltransferase